MIGFCESTSSDILVGGGALIADLSDPSTYILDSSHKFCSSGISGILQNYLYRYKEPQANIPRLGVPYALEHEGTICAYRHGWYPSADREGPPCRHRWSWGGTICV
jgi:hypothetical protein